MDKTVCELFAGVGGFRIGLEKADSNWDTVWANQWEPGKKNQYAFDCYVSHFGKSENYICSPAKGHPLSKHQQRHKLHR